MQSGLPSSPLPSPQLSDSVSVVGPQCPFEKSELTGSSSRDPYFGLFPLTPESLRNSSLKPLQYFFAFASKFRKTTLTRRIYLRLLKPDDKEVHITIELSNNFAIRMVKSFDNNAAVDTSQPGIRGRLLCRECRHRRKPVVSLKVSKTSLIAQCLYMNPEEPCEYCIAKGVTCGPKVSKQEFHCREGEANTSLYSMQAAAFIEFWLKSMKIHNPAGREDDLLAAFRQAVEQKQNQLALKRRRAESDPIVTSRNVETLPPVKKRSTDGDFSAAKERNEGSPSTAASTVGDNDSDRCSEGSIDAKEENIDQGRIHFEGDWEMHTNGPVESMMSGSFSMDAPNDSVNLDDWERILFGFAPVE